MSLNRWLVGGCWAASVVMALLAGGLGVVAHQQAEELVQLRPALTAADQAFIDRQIAGANQNGDTASAPQVQTVQAAHAVTFTSTVKPKDKDAQAATFVTVFDGQDRPIGTLSAAGS